VAVITFRQFPRPAFEQITKDDIPSDEEIKKLMARLAEVKDPYIGLSGGVSGRAFAPIESAQQVDVMLVDHDELSTSAPLKRLVELGPHSLPFLVAALEDKTPTQLKIQSSGAVNGGFPDDGKPYSVKVGDVCYVALGQIVGRDYQAVRYIPSNIIAIESPTQDPKLAGELRAQWSSDNPAEHLYKALLADYRTKPVFNGESLDGWGDGSDLQVRAAMRMLYYFPKRSAPMIADRLNRLKVETPIADLDNFIKREVTNGIRTPEFITAVAWSKDAGIREALLGIFQRTNNIDVLRALMPVVKRTHPEWIPTRLEKMLDNLPESEESPNRDGYKLLLELGRNAGPAAKPIFRKYLRINSLQRCETMCLVLGRVHGDWAIELLSPMLPDERTRYKRTYTIKDDELGPRNPVRLCDAAAEVIAKHNPELKFVMKGEYKDLDQQIAKMRAAILRMKKPSQ
jgi:hypothetical protein